jgi:hypothetical protein
MSNHLEISIKRSLGDSTFINDSITLFCKSEISPWGANDFLWEGEYENETIVVKLPRGNSESLAKIQKSDSLKIDDQIVQEIKRVLRKLK